LLNNKRKTTGEKKEEEEIQDTYERKTIEIIELPDL